MAEGVANDGSKWSLGGIGTDVLRVQYSNAVVQFPLAELLTAAQTAVNVEYDDDYGSPLKEVTLSDANGDEIDRVEGVTSWGNERFTVIVAGAEADGPLHVSVHDHGRNAQIPWRILQRIKNEVAGPDRWACEWFPPEGNLMDEANERHLWVWPEGVEPPAPLAYHGPRTVADETEARDYGARQDPLPVWYPEKENA